MKMSRKYEIKEIGAIKIDEEGFYIELNEKYQDALKEVDGFTHLNILWWAHHFNDDMYREATVSEKPYKNAPDVIGMFATRSPVRPNPIGLSIVQVLSIDGNKIRVPYIDADADTPILDIKPYQPCTDRVKNTSVPEWCSHWPQYYEDSATFDWEAEFENAR